MEIAIISDTHMPRAGRRLPEACVERLRRAGLIIHAGDLMQLSVLRQLESYGEVIAVHGNVDDVDVRSVLPAVQKIKVQATTIVVVHDAGPASGRMARMRSRFPDADAVVFGHSHIPLHERAEDGFQLFNPGSPTERRRAPERTMGLGRLDEHGVRFELISLGLL